jgi:hypothetical protein
MKRISLIALTLIILVSSGCTLPVGTTSRTGTVESLINLATSIPGLPEGMIPNGYTAGIQNGVNIVSYYVTQDQKKTLMVNVFVNPVKFENPNMDPILALRPEDVVSEAPTVGDSSRLYIQNDDFQLVFIKGTIRAMLVGKGLKQPEVIKIARKIASSLPEKVQIPASLPTSSRKLDPVLHDRYLKSSVLFISDQDAAPINASTCPTNAYITFNFDLSESLPRWKIQLLDANKNVINEMVKDSAEKKNTSLVIPALVSAGEYEVLFYINDTLVFDDLIRCGK